MDAALVAGCAVGGLAIGGCLDSLSGRIVRAPEPSPPSASLEPATVGAGRSGTTPPASSVVPPTTLAIASRRRPGRAEIAVSALLTALLFGLAAWRLGAVPALAGYCALFAGLIAASIVDARLAIVPRTILYPTLVVTALGIVAASAVDHRWRALGDAAIGGVAAFAVFFVLWWCFPRGIGYGDVRLAGVIGAALGWIGFGEIYVGFLAAFAVGTAVGFVVMTRQGTGRKTRLAFGPALSIGAAFGVLWGPWAVHVWLHHG